MASAEDRIINKMPMALITCSVYSDLTDFDRNVKEYCHSLKLNRPKKIDLRSSKVIIIGDMGSGKTCLLQRFVNNSFNNDYKSTIGVDFEVEQFRVLNLPFNLQIWDTAGQERFKCIAAAYYRGAQAIVVTFDLMNRESLFNTEKWLIDALKVIKYDEQTPRVFLVGTKNDLIKNATCYTNETHEMASNLASRLNAEYWPLSSLTGENVRQFFFRLTAILFNDSIKREFSDEEHVDSNSKRSISTTVSTEIQIKGFKSISLIDHKNLENMITNKCC